MKYLLCIIAFTAMLASCKKWQDSKGPADPRLSRPYCNDPDAVNYNWDFPGTPDNTVCFYPAGLFTGSYIFKDSSYFSDNTTLDSDHVVTRQFAIYELGKSKLALVGYCGGTDTFKFTADRYYNATADTILTNGQIFCNIKDTFNGTLIKVKDSAGKTLKINFTVISDSVTGVRYHRGTAIKQ